MKNEQASIIGVYPYPHYANKGKVEKVLEVLKEYRKTAQKIANLQWNYFYKNQTFNKYISVKEVESKLSERYKQSCLWQVYVVKEKEPNKAKEFDYWIRFSTLEKGKPVYIPLKKNSYAEALEGEFLNFIQVVQLDDGDIEIKRVKELKKKNYTPITESIAIDLGLTPLFATDKGDLFGRNFIEKLKEFDRKITNRMAYLQKNNTKPSSDKKYRELVRKFREFVKNEINRLLNRLLEIYKPAKIIVEKLDFRSPELSKRLNRLIQNFGRRFVREKLKRFEELYSIQVIEVNSAYTSQECSSCGYVDKNNRKDTQVFECKACKLQINAQVNGARNIGRRSSLADIVKPHTPKKKLLQILIKRYLERYNGCNSPPVDLLKNPYFRDFLGRSKPLECELNKCL